MTGFCACGCGEQTQPAKRTMKRYGWVKGQPLPFLQGHYARTAPPSPLPGHEPGTVRIPLSGGYFATVDEADGEKLSRHRWRAQVGKRSVYAVRRQRRGEVEPEQTEAFVYMHREVLGLEPGDGLKVDHINHDGLDNRRGNLRACTHAQNMSNQRGSVGSSRYKGVTWDGSRGVWLARIQIDGRNRHLGSFGDEAEAARAYDVAAADAWGEFAGVNFAGGEG